MQMSKRASCNLFIKKLFNLFVMAVLFGDIGVYADTQVAFLNAKEKQWIQEHPVVKVGITQIPNQVLKTKTGYKGYSIDYFNAIESLVGIKFEYVYYETWQALLEAAKKGEVSVVFLAQKTPERLAYFDFTDVVLQQQNKIITSLKQYVQEGVTLENLFGKRVAVIQGSAIDEYIDLNYPEIVVVHVDKESTALQKVLDKEADFAIVEPVRASYYMEKKNINNLYISGDFPYEYRLRIASRRDIPVLSIILNKAVEHISPLEKKSWLLKWGYEKELFFDTKLLINIAVVFSIAVMFLVYLYILNRKLQRAKKSLQKINETLELKVAAEVEKNRQKDLAMLNQSRYAQMGQVINMIAHQWRQPLNTVSLIMQTMVLKCKKNTITPEELEKFKQKMSLQIQQMSKTVDDFRNFFKEEKEKKDFSLKELLKSIVNIVEPVLEKSGITLVVEVQEEIMLSGFANELSQAIINIIYNAKDAFAEKVQENKTIEISLRKGDTFTILCIRDNAGGIEEDILEKIFEPYFSTKGKNGTGIGLYMSKMIIEKHMDGKLKVYNADGGAVFEIELPL